MKLRVLSMVMFSLLASSAFATANSSFQAQTNEEVANDEVFLGCFKTRTLCVYNARNHGLHHTMTEIDHHVCHDHHYPVACYGVED